jgi:RNA polymerase sigma factor (sigma-70 family)
MQKPAPTKTSEYRTDRAIREKIFKIPLLPQDKAVLKIAELDTLLYPHALALTKRFPLLRNYFEEVMFRIASGNTQGKNYYNKEDHEDDKKKKKLLQNSEKRVLIESFSLLRLKDLPERFCHVIKHASFLRGVFEEAVELFLETTLSYPDDLKAMQLAAREHSPDFVELETKIRRVENELGCHDPAEILEWVAKADHVWTQYVLLREELISPYFRLVYSLAQKYASSPAQILDNFQNGVFGLVRAVKCYTPTRFAAFSVVATQWIKQSILLQLKSEVNLIKLPVASWHLYQKLEKIRNEIEKTTQKSATHEEIAAAAKLPVEKIQKIYENAKLVQVLSLNNPTHNEDQQAADSKWNMESIPASQDQHDLYELKSEFLLIEKVLDLMDEEERVIFGLVSGCFDLIPEPALDPTEILRETIRQKAARRHLTLIFK